MRRTLFLSCFMTVSFFSGSLFGERISLDAVMTEDDQKKMGLDNLPISQKRAFEEWLGAWTLKVISQAPTYHSSLNLQAWIEGWPHAVAPRTTAKPHEVAEENKELNRRIDKNLEDGAILELKDGSVWRIAPFDTYKTRRWLRGDELEWAKVDPSIDSRNPYRIYNVTRQQVAYAKQEKPPATTGQREAKSEEHYANSVRLVGVRNEGELVVLEDNTTWKILVTDAEKTQSWRSNDRIRVQVGKTRDVMYDTLLTNLESGETVKAKQVKPR